MYLHFTGICKSYNGRTVLENISGAINVKDKIGLVGRNGIGKTTLARVLAGLETFDRGQIERSPAYGKIFYLEQYPEFPENDSVYETVLKAAKNNYRIRDAETTVKKSFNLLGVSEEKWEQVANSLSGGEKTRLALCRVVVSDFDLLVMDEPTNHLDLDNCEWLENFVRDLKKTIVVISHDRYFLDKFVTRIWELTSRGLEVYEGNYSSYRRQKEIEQKHLIKEYQKQQAKIHQLKQVISDRENWYKSAHTAAGQNDFYRSKAKKHAGVIKAKKKELERIEKTQIAKPKKLSVPAFELINKNILGRKLPPVLVRAENVGKSFGKKVVFQDASFNIKRGDKIALIGANGTGKTTLLNIIAGLITDYSGEVAVSPSVKLGYFAQELDNLDFGATILDEVLTVGAKVEEARLLLATLLFRGDAVYKKIARLSMGEKGRVAFAKLILTGANFLLLDELTNYMDLESKEKIEEVLADYHGSLLFVTHDRYFMRLANRVFVMADGKLDRYDGNYEYYLTKHRKKSTSTVQQDLYHKIIQLECELAFLGGKLNKTRDEQEKEKLQEKYLLVARELNHCKELRKE